MAWQIPLSISTTSNALALSGSDSAFVGKAITLASSEGIGIASYHGNWQKVAVHGTVVGMTGMHLGAVTNATIEVAQTGHVAGVLGSGISSVGDKVLIRNAGLVESLHNGSTAIYLNGVAPTDVQTVENNGTITGSTGIFANSGLGAFNLTNSGLIEGSSFSIESIGSTIDNIVNTGQVLGAVSLGGGDDLFDSRIGTVGEVIGGAGNDRLYAGAGANTLVGAAGNDTLMGGAGADTLDGGSEVDTASYASASAGVTASLSNAAANAGDAAGDSFVGIERLVGTKFADKLIGDDGANQLTGGAGADSLTGGAGADRFVFNAKPAGSATADRITDFATDLDELRLDDASFAGLALGALAGGAFWASNAGTAHDGSDRVIYEKDTGWLRFDADGSGAGAAVQFAKLAAGLNLGADDIFVY